MANKLPSIIQSGNNQYPTPSISLNRIATDFYGPGVVGVTTNTAGVAPTTGALAVNAQASPNMTVAVSGGVGYVLATPTGGIAQLLGVTADVSENVTIAANSSGSTVYDFVYLKLDPDKLNNPASNGLDVATYVTSRSTTNYNSALRSTTAGNSNGAQANCELLAVVTVVNLAASIANSAIQDARQPVSTTINNFKATGGILANVPTFKATVSTAGIGAEAVYGTINIPAYAVAVNVWLFAKMSVDKGSGAPTLDFTGRIRRTNIGGTVVEASSQTKSAAAGISDQGSIAMFTVEQVAANTATPYVLTMTGVGTPQSSVAGQFMAFVTAQ